MGNFFKSNFSLNSATTEEVEEAKTVTEKTEDELENDKEEIGNLKKKLKKQDEKIVKLRNDAQKYKIDLDKATKIIEREIGEGLSIDEILKSDSKWKGRAQKIEQLKAKIRKIKVDWGDTVSISTVTSDFSTTKSHAEKNLENMGTNRARELEKLKEELVLMRDQFEILNQKYKGAWSRKVAVENETKELKSLMASKVKILLDKTENDDKLINMLRAEVSRLKTGKAGKVEKSKGDKGTDDKDELIYKLNNEIAKLKNSIIVQEVEIGKKDSKLKELTKNWIGAPNEELEERDAMIYELEQKIEELERQTQEKFTRKTQTESEQLIKELSQQNAKLRLKINELQDKLKS